MLMITNIENYIQAVNNLSNPVVYKEFVENLSPRYVDVLSRVTVGGGVSPSPTSPLDSAINNLMDSGLQDSVINKHSIGIVGLLCAKTKTQDFNNNFENFLVQFSAFMDIADYFALRNVAHVVWEIGSSVADQMIRRNQPILGINLLGNLATRLQSHDKMLTSVHPLVLQLCCASFNFKAGLKFIIDDFDEFTNDLKGSDNTESLVSYLYYSGLIHLALKNYTTALYYFEACVRVPAVTLSHVMLETYKKYVLVSLIQSGAVPQPHKTALQVVNRLLKPNAVAYNELATAFAVGNDALSNCVAKHLDTFRRDCNYGLVKQVRAAHMRVIIRKLTRTFLTLSLEEVGRRAGADVPEQIILGMIQKKLIHAKISQRNCNVRFLDPIAAIQSDSPFIHVIEDKINSCVELNRRVATMNERISTNPEFISKVVLNDSSTPVTEDTGSGSSSQQISSSAPKFNATRNNSNNSQPAGPSAFNL